jgi:membrane protein DedA with SNARE-associated domain
MPAWAEVYLTANNPGFYPIVFLLLLLAGLGFPISADLVLLTCSYIAYTGHAEYIYLIPISILAILLSDTLMYGVGKNLGFRLTQVWPLKSLLTPERIENAKSSFHVHGYRIVFLARFMPGIRTVFMFTSGLLKLRYWKFIAHDFAGAIIVIPSMLYSMKWVAGNKEVIMEYIHRFQWLILAAVVLYFSFWFYKRRSVRKKSIMF